MAEQYDLEETLRMLTESFRECTGKVTHMRPETAQALADVLDFAAGQALALKQSEASLCQIVERLTKRITGLEQALNARAIAAAGETVEIHGGGNVVALLRRPALAAPGGAA